MLSLPLRDLFVASTIFIIGFYGSCNIFTEVLRTFFPFGVIFIIILASALYFLRIPPPPLDAVETIVGKEPHLATNEDHHVMRTVAHRGAGLDAPENSLAAFKQCSDKGCDAIEFDVTLTADDVPVIFHDATLERMTDLDLAVGAQKWSTLQNIDISVKHCFKERFANSNIPTLEQTVTQLLASGQRMFIDIKDNNKKLVKVIHDLYDKYPDLYSRAVVTSFFPNIIYFIRRGNPKIVCSMAWRPHCFAYDGYNYPQGKGERRAQSWYKHYFLCFCDILHDWALPRVTYYLVGLSIILLHKDTVNGRSVLEWRKRGLRVIAWTVNTPAEKQYLARVLKITYLTDTLTGEATTHSFPNNSI